MTFDLRRTETVLAHLRPTILKCSYRAGACLESCAYYWLAMRMCGAHIINVCTDTEVRPTLMCVCVRACVYVHIMCPCNFQLCLHKYVCPLLMCQVVSNGRLFCDAVVTSILSYCKYL